MLKLSCLVYDDLSFYDLRGLRSDSGYSVAPSNGVSHNYTFNLCSFIAQPCNGHKVFGCKDSADGEFSLTSGSLDNLTSTVEEGQDGTKFVHMMFAGGDQCADNKSYSMTVDLYCNDKGTREEAPLVRVNVE